MTETTWLAAVIGANARRVRLTAGATLEQVARAARANGLKWSSGKVGDLESGRVAPSLATIVPLAMALQEATSTPVTIAELVVSDGYVRLNSDMAIKGKALAKVLSSETAPFSLPVSNFKEESEDVARRMRDGIAVILEDISGTEGWESIPHLRDVRAGDFRKNRHRFSETERRLAKELAEPYARICFESLHLWGKSFTEERDARAGKDANAQKRGIVARALKKELKASIEQYPTHIEQGEA
jgi:transcriptional regulator with XRE-family HTH domain